MTVSFFKGQTHFPDFSHLRGRCAGFSAVSLLSVGKICFQLPPQERTNCLVRGVYVLCELWKLGKLLGWLNLADLNSRPSLVLSEAFRVQVL